MKQPGDALVNGVSGIAMRGCKSLRRSTTNAAPQPSTDTFFSGSAQDLRRGDVAAAAPSSMATFARVEE